MRKDICSTYNLYKAIYQKAYRISINQSETDRKTQEKNEKTLKSRFTNEDIN